jgi:hypothetical protein
MKLVPVIALLVLLAGCSPEPAQVIVVTTSPSPSTSATAGPTVDGWNNARAFTDAALQGKYSAAKPYVSPGSEAARYLQHQVAMDRAITAAGDGGMPSTHKVTYDDGAATVTFSYPDDPTKTITWQDFEYDPSGLVVRWQTGASLEKLSDRLWSKPARASTSHAKVELVSAYRNDSALFVVLKVTAKDRTIMPDCSPLLTQVDHSQREATDCSAPESLSKSKSAYVAYTFDGATSGGTLRYLIEDTNWTELNAVKLLIRLGAEDPAH